jgi:hypothetical protein
MPTKQIILSNGYKFDVLNINKFADSNNDYITIRTNINPEIEENAVSQNMNIIEVNESGKYLYTFRDYNLEIMTEIIISGDESYLIIRAFKKHNKLDLTGE